MSLQVPYFLLDLIALQNQAYIIMKSHCVFLSLLVYCALFYIQVNQCIKNASFFFSLARAKCSLRLHNRERAFQLSA
jgi:hypothetical protein